MTVTELIRRLGECDPDAEVTLSPTIYRCSVGSVDVEQPHDGPAEVVLS